MLESSELPHCMGCRGEFNSLWLTNNGFPRTFINGQLKKHIANVLFQKERAKMPETQERVAVLREADEMESRSKEIKKQMDTLKRSLNELSTEYDILRREIRRRRDVKFVPTERRVFTMPCSVANCRGFIDEEFKCGICSVFTCGDCLQPIGISKTDTPHVCDPDMIATAKMIKDSSRGCPGCGERISKIDGCDQMWCPSCHVAFSWRTGEIENGRIHNPHYYQWMRANAAGGVIPREPNDPGRLVHDLGFVIRNMQAHPFLTFSPAAWPVDIITELNQRGFNEHTIRNMNVMLKMVNSVCQAKHFIETNTIHYLNRMVTNATDLALANDERAKFMLEKTSEPAFKKRLVDNTNIRQHCGVFIEIYRGFVEKMNDYGNEFCDQFFESPILAGVTPSVEDSVRIVGIVTEVYLKTMRLAVDVTTSLWQTLKHYGYYRGIHEHVKLIIPGIKNRNGNIQYPEIRHIPLVSPNTTPTRLILWPDIVTGNEIIGRLDRKFENYWTSETIGNAGRINRLAAAFGEKNDDNRWFQLVSSDWVAISLPK